MFTKRVKLIPFHNFFRQYSRNSWDGILLRKITPHALFSLFLITLTAFSFWLIYQNLRQQQRLTELKNYFISNVTHELKTPISGIKLGLQLLENPKTGALNPDQMQLLQDIKYDSDRLLRITSELLNMTQLETGKIDIKL